MTSSTPCFLPYQSKQFYLLFKSSAHYSHLILNKIWFLFSQIILGKIYKGLMMEARGLCAICCLLSTNMLHVLVLGADRSQEVYL